MFMKFIKGTIKVYYLIIKHLHKTNRGQKDFKPINNDKDLFLKTKSLVLLLL